MSYLIECKKCVKCKITKANRNCIDCNILYCNSCYKEDHTTIWRSSHISRDIKTNAYIKDAYSGKDDSMADCEVPSTDDLFPEMNKSLSDTEDEQNLNSFYTSLSITRAPLFETNIITEYDSVACLSSLLEVDIDAILNTVTFIEKHSENSEPVVNSLLIKDGSYKIPRYSGSSPVCRLACDSNEKLLILHTENMYKGLEGKTADQANLLRLLMSLSDVIVFVQTSPDKTEDSKKSLKRDYLRMHDIMGLCKKEFNALFSKINKKEPQKLAPGLIYLVKSEIKSSESLSEAIVNCTGRIALYESFSKIIHYDGKSDAMFQEGLSRMLQDLSRYRNRHSLTHIFSAIKQCKYEIDALNTEPFCPNIPNEWFVCGQLCSICQATCSKSVGHADVHDSSSPCRETEKNRVYFCKKCYNEESPTKRSPLVFKPKGRGENILTGAIWYTFRGKVIECDKHGIINDSNWLYKYYEDTVIVRYIHEWPGWNLITQNVYPMSQMCVDKMSEVSRPIQKIISDSASIIADNFINPSTWERGTSVFECKDCKSSFKPSMVKHHCRICGNVVCSNCFTNDKSQKLCKSCSGKNLQDCPTEEPRGLMVLNLMRYPISVAANLVKRTVTSINRPDYWEDDSQAIHCSVCDQGFDDEMRPIHHCRSCGKCVCDDCSSNLRPVEWRFLYEPSRVCDKCVEGNCWKNMHYCS